MGDVNVPFQLSVPIDLVVDLKERLRVMVEAHEREVAKVAAKSSKADPKKLQALNDRTKLLTMNNFVRLAVIHGVSNVVGMKDEVINSHLATIGVARGRPRG